MVADSVNPLPMTREAWRGVAAESGARLIEVELVCSDPAEHRRRVEQRILDIPGLAQPDWAAVTERAYAPWDRPPLTIDTASTTPEAAAARIVAVAS